MSSSFFIQYKLSFATVIISLLFLLIFTQLSTTAQSYRNWTRNFNDESSLLGGAVVGGGMGPSAIYFNPASISEAVNSSLSLHASLFSLNSYDMYNALGDGNDLTYTQLQIQPRFISYLIDPKRKEKFTVEIAFLNNEIFKQDFNTAVDNELDILTSVPGHERHFTSFQYYNTYRDDWLGIGGSWLVHPNISLGLSMFVLVKSFEYRLEYDSEAYPTNDTVYVGGAPIEFYSASFQTNEYLHFADFRLLWKMGAMYANERFSFGVVFKTPSIHVLANGKRMLHKRKQANIGRSESEEFLPDYIIVDYKEKKDVKVNFKDPFSIAAGLTVYSKDGHRTLFTTVEYFNGIDQYNFMQADANLDDISGGSYDVPPDMQWMSFVHGARPVFNAAVGYRWTIKESLLIMGGFRTDFNSRKNMEFLEDPNVNFPKALNLDVYHLSGGVRFIVRGQDLIAGLQYSHGRQNNVEQYANLSDPDEYNLTENAALQGSKQNNMDVRYNGLSLYFGATLNFGAGKNKKQDK